MTNEERLITLEKLKDLKQTRDNLNDELKEINNQIYNIQRKLGYYAKNEILYGIEYD